MLKVFDIVRDKISGHPAMVLSIDLYRNSIDLIDCKTKMIIKRGSDDLDPWKPRGGGGGNSAMPIESIDEVTYLKALLHNDFTISDTNEIRFHGVDAEKCEAIINKICNRVLQLDQEKECAFA